MDEWWKDPKFLIIGGVAAFAAFVLLRNQGSSSQATGQQNIGDFQTQNLTTPVGQSYQYLDGQGMQHLIATDPYGNLTGSVLPADISAPQTGQLSSYVGMMGHQYIQPYGYMTPYYAQSPYYNN